MYRNLTNIEFKKTYTGNLTNKTPPRERCPIPKIPTEKKQF